MKTVNCCTAIVVLSRATVLCCVVPRRTYQQYKIARSHGYRGKLCHYEMCSKNYG